MQRRTLLIGGREVVVSLTAPLTEGTVLTDDFGARWHGTIEDAPMALVADEAIGFHIEVGPGAGEDLPAEFTATTPVPAADLAAAKEKIRKRRKAQPLDK